MLHVSQLIDIFNKWYEFENDEFSKKKRYFKLTIKHNENIFIDAYKIISFQLSEGAASVIRGAFMSDHKVRGYDDMASLVFILTRPLTISSGKLKCAKKHHVMC